MLRTLAFIFLINTMFVGERVLSETPKPSITVTTTGFEFIPNTWTISSQQETSLNMINTTVQEHEWVLLKRGTKVTLPFGADDEEKVYWEIEAKAGETIEGTFIAPLEPGSYDIVCGKPRHIERGMKGTLIVK